MSIYKCSLPTCPNQYTDGTPRKRLYCTAHYGHEPKLDGGLFVPDDITEKIVSEIQHGVRTLDRPLDPITAGTLARGALLKHLPAPGNKITIHLTDEQVAELRDLLIRNRSTVEITNGPPVIVPKVDRPIDRLIRRLETEVKKGNEHGYPEPTVWAIEESLKWAREEAADA